MISRWLWQIRAALGLYSSVKFLIAPYLLAVVIGMVLEASALGAIVPLIGGQGQFAEVYFDFLERIGLPANDASLIGLIAVLFVARSIAQYISGLLGGMVVRREGVRLQVELFTLYLGLSWNEMVKRSRGEVNLLLNSHTHEVALFMYRCINVMEGVVYAFGLTAVAVVISPSNTFLAVALIGASLGGVALISTRVRRYAQSVLEKSQDQANRLLEYAAHAPLIRAYGVGNEAITEIRTRAEERERLAFRSQRIESLGWVLPDLLFVLALLSVVALAYQAGDDLAEIGAIIALLYRVSQYLKRFADFSSLSAALPTVRTVHRFRRLFQAHQAAAVESNYDTSLPQGTVIVEDVSFSYADEAHAAVESVSFRVEPGEFLGIVGPSGSGKSTLAQLIVGLLAPQRGIIVVGASDGGGVGYVPQTPVVLSGTVASNVAWFRGCDDAQVEEACRAAGLGPVLARMSDGVHTKIGQDGLTLSGGERQRLALARALVGKPAVLVLDEATSALDAESEAAVQESIAQLHGQVTVLAIAHRLATVMNAQEILVMEEGRVVESGAPSVLITDRHSTFARLASLQHVQDF